MPSVLLNHSQPAVIGHELLSHRGESSDRRRRKKEANEAKRLRTDEVDGEYLATLRSEVAGREEITRWREASWCEGRRVERIDWRSHMEACDWLWSQVEEKGSGQKFQTVTTTPG